jgi:hypothetical protein
MELPGWNSIEATNSLSDIFFWLSIIALLLLGVAEVVSHRYGERHDWLLNQKHQAEKSASDLEIARLHSDTAKAEKTTAELAGKFGGLSNLVRTTETKIAGEIVEFQKRTDAEMESARQTIAGAKDTIAELNRDRADLAKAHDEAIAAAKIAMQEAMPRVLSPEQQANFTNSLKAYRDTIVSVWRFPSGTADTSPLAIALMKLLVAADWKARGVSISWSSGYAKGVLVMKRSGSSPAVGKAADALVQALTAAGLAATTYKDFDKSDPAFGNGMVVPGPDPDIILFVGDKP